MKESFGISGLGQSIHQDVINALKDNNKTKQLGLNLNTLFNLRKKADYNMYEIIYEYNAKNSISLAKYILEQYRNISENSE